MSTESGQRLAIFLPHLHGGGAERVSLNLAQAFVDLGHPVDLVLVRAEGAYSAGVPEGVRVVDLNATRAIASLWGLRRYLRTEKPTAMLSVMHYTNIVALWAHRLAGVSTRLVVSEHDTASESYRHSRRLRSRMLPLLARRYYPRADAIVAVSGGVADDLARVIGVPRQSITVIVNAVITPELVAASRADVDHPFFDPGQPPVILGIGRLTEKKDFAMLISAFATLRKERPVRLMILGEGRDRVALEAQIHELGLDHDTAMPGFVSNPYKYISRASLFALSSRWEGLPTVLIEALYCGLPIVATDCPSGPSEILDRGRYGTLVPVGDAAALAEAMDAALDDGLAVPSEESWHQYRPEIVARAYLDVLLPDRPRTLRSGS